MENWFLSVTVIVPDDRMDLFLVRYLTCNNVSFLICPDHVHETDKQEMDFYWVLILQKMS